MRANALILALFLVSTQAFAQAEVSPSTSIENRTRQFFKAQLSGDAEANLTLCSDEVVFLMGGLIRKATKEDLVELTKNSPATWSRVEIVDGPSVSLDPNGYVAYVTVTVHGVATLRFADGRTEPYESTDAYIQVWSKSGDDWLLSALAMDTSTDPSLKK